MRGFCLAGVIRQTVLGHVRVEGARSRAIGRHHLLHCGDGWSTTRHSSFDHALSIFFSNATTGNNEPRASHEHCQGLSFPRRRCRRVSHVCEKSLAGMSQRSHPGTVTTLPALASQSPGSRVTACSARIGRDFVIPPAFLQIPFLELPRPRASQPGRQASSPWGPRILSRQRFKPSSPLVHLDVLFG